MHCNLRPPEPRQPFPALITTPCQVWRRSGAEPIHCRRPIIAFLLLIHYFTPWPWPLTFDLEHLQCITCDVMKLCTKFERKQSAAELLRLQCLTLWPWTCFKCCARLWDNFRKVWPSKTYPCLNYSVFWCWYVMWSCDLDLWPVDLESLWHIRCHVIKVCTKFERNRVISGWIIDKLRIFAHVMLRRDLDFWPLDLELLQHFGCYAEPS